MPIQLRNRNKNLVKDAALINNYINDNTQGLSKLWWTWDIDKMSSDLNMNPPQLYYTLRTLGVAVALFTGDSVATVRSPEIFEPAKAERSYSVLGVGGDSFKDFKDFLAIKNPEDMNMKPTQRDYTTSRSLLMKLASISSHASTTGVSITTLYRGLESIDYNTLNSWVRTGTIFSLGILASSTMIHSKSKDFSSSYWSFSTLSSRKKSKYKEGGIILIINNKKNKGLYVEGLSTYPSEREVILSGDVVTVGCSGMTAEWSDNSIVLKETTDWDIIVKSKKAAKIDIEHAVPNSNTFKNATAILAAPTTIYVDLI